MRKESGLHYAWVICIGCALLIFCTSGLSINAFSVHQPYIISVNGFTNTQSSLIITFRNLLSFISMLLAGKYFKLLGLRKGMLIAGLCTAFGFFLFGLANSFFIYSLGASFVGIGFGLGAMIPITIVLEHWFLERRNIAIGICSAVTGLSTLGIPSVLSKAIESAGLSTVFYVESVVIAALVVISFLLIRSAPEDMGLSPFGEASQETIRLQEQTGLIRSDWLLLIPMLLLIGAVLNVAYSHLTVLMTGEGASSSITAAAISVSGLGLMAGKLVYGRVSDQIGTYKSNYLFGTILLIGFVLCCLIRYSTVLLFTGMAVYSFGAGFLSIGLSSWVTDLSSQKDFDDNVRRFQLGYSAGCLAFSSLPGILADRSGGSYVPAYALFFVFSVLVITALQLVFIRVRKRRIGGRNP